MVPVIEPRSLWANVESAKRNRPVESSDERMLTPSRQPLPENGLVKPDLVSIQTKPECEPFLQERLFQIPSRAVVGRPMPRAG